MRTTFATSLGRKRHLRSVIVRVTLDDGAEGAGEVPTSAAFEDETIAVIGRVLDEGRRRLKGAEIGDYEGRLDELRAAFPHAMMTTSGLEVACFRACLASRGVPEHLWWGGKSLRIETDITVPILTDKRALAAWVEGAARKGFTAYKVKVSGNLEQDREMVAFIHRLLSARIAAFRLRLDGNQGYTAETFLAFVDFLQKMRFEIELFEQPLPKGAFKGLAYIKERCPIPIILDETIRTVEDARRAVDHNLCHGINIKIAKSGIGGSIEAPGAGPPPRDEANGRVHDRDYGGAVRGGLFCRRHRCLRFHRSRRGPFPIRRKRLSRDRAGRPVIPHRLRSVKNRPIINERYGRAETALSWRMRNDGLC